MGDPLPTAVRGRFSLQAVLLFWPQDRPFWGAVPSVGTLPSAQRGAFLPSWARTPSPRGVHRPHARPLLVAGAAVRPGPLGVCPATVRS